MCASNKGRGNRKHVNTLNTGLHGWVSLNHQIINSFIDTLGGQGGTEAMQRGPGNARGFHLFFPREEVNCNNVQLYFLCLMTLEYCVFNTWSTSVSCYMWQVKLWSTHFQLRPRTQQQCLHISQAPTFLNNALCHSFPPPCKSSWISPAAIPCPRHCLYFYGNVSLNLGRVIWLFYTTQ